MMANAHMNQIGCCRSLPLRKKGPCCFTRVRSMEFCFLLGWTSFPMDWPEVLIRIELLLDKLNVDMQVSAVWM
jgi:hypothetical protein